MLQLEVAVDAEGAPALLGIGSYGHVLRVRLPGGLLGGDGAPLTLALKLSQHAAMHHELAVMRAAACSCPCRPGQGHHCPPSARHVVRSYACGMAVPAAAVAAAAATAAAASAGLRPAAVRADGVLFALLMEYAAEGTLEDLVEAAGPLPPWLVCDAVRQMLIGLHQVNAHAAAVHRVRRWRRNARMPPPAQCARVGQLCVRSLGAMLA